MISFAITLLIAFFLRMVGINWDQGTHLHPDERMLIMVSDKIHFFDQLDPNFFNYGSLPIYLLRAVTQIIYSIVNIPYSLYDSMLYIGRGLSLTADLLVVLLVYKLSLKLFKDKRIAIFSSLLYSLAFFPIQNTHFFIVDTFLNLFLILTIYSLLRYMEKMTIYRLIVVSLSFSAVITTKITGIIFLPFILLVIWYQNRKKSFGPIIFQTLIFAILSVFFSFIFMPYAFLHWQKFLADVLQQLQLNSDPYVFPYTLQYVGTTPYLYYLRNIFLWGLGPIIATLSVFGFVAVLSNAKTRNTKLILVMVFYIFYFLVIGRSAVKFMRYMLPIYPLASILAAYGLNKVLNGKSHVHSARLRSFLICLILALVFGWTLLFNSIYLREHTRITASNWILKNIPTNSTIAVEHWDDRLPLGYSEKFMFNELQLYNTPDDYSKWAIIKGQLSNSDYLIIASNRLYTPLQKLADCKKYRYCYPKTSIYYKKLFAQQLGFKKVAEFSSQPSLKIGNWELKIDDSSADESFTVYDHPKIFIFKKIN